MRRLIATLVAAALAGLAACSSMPSLNPLDWWSGPAGPKPAELPPLTGAQPVRVLWSASVGTADRFFFSPVLSGDSVYAAARDGTVARIDAATGQVRWRSSAGVRLSAGVGSDGVLVAVATEEGEVIALDAKDGKPRWKTRASSEVIAPPVVAADLVLVRSADSRIFAFDPADGKRRWVFQRAAGPLAVRSPAGVTVHDKLAYAGFSGGKLVAISLANGAMRWEATVASPKGSTELERVADIMGVPAAQGREVCAAAYQGRVGCYDAQNGTQQWVREFSTLTGVSFDARYAFLSDDRGAVHALDRSNGRSVWKQDRLAHRRLSLPLPIESEVAVGDLQGYVHFLSREAGTFLARFATDGSPVLAAPLKLPSGLLVQTRNGGLYALSLK
ncbi:MAG TPA: outer membrane protein assembly factor BamB [Burkholderiales bacterium]|nr:outer membrane protein assembly factor BamB [Burkholderiales bacterium]